MTTIESTTKSFRLEKTKIRSRCSSSFKMYTKFALFSLAFLPSVLSSPIEARACVGPNINDDTVALIKEFEGFVKSPAPDPINLPTVGYGHLCQTKGCSEVPYSFPLTEATATKLLMSDVKVWPLFRLRNALC